MGTELQSAGASPSCAMLVRHGMPLGLAKQLPRPLVEALAVTQRMPEFVEPSAPVLPLTVMALRPVMPVSATDLQAALDVVEVAMRPGREADVIKAMLRMRVVTRSREMGRADEELMWSVFAEKLAKYPADAVAAACERWLETSPFWPSVSEILPYCEWAMQPRRELQVLLLRALGRLPGQAAA